MAGGSLGALLAGSQASEEATNNISFGGGLTGLSLDAPLGGHLANGRRGNYVLGALASTGIVLTGIALLLLREHFTRTHLDDVPFTDDLPTDRHHDTKIDYPAPAVLPRKRNRPLLSALRPRPMLK